MAILSHPAFGPRTALMYVTGGLLLDVWTAVYYFAFVSGPVSNMTWFWLIGLFLTGLVFIALGLLLGPLGRAARQAELPPAEAIQAEAAIQQTAAANPPAVVTPNAAAAVPANAAMPAQPVPAPQSGVPSVAR
jgi:hypothetical protein